MKHDSKKRYGSISKTFHWLMAGLIGWQLFKFGDRIAEGEHWVGEILVPWHVSIGTLLLVLIVLRLAWVITQRHRRPAHDPAIARLVKAGHGLLFAGMLLMPITGMMVMLGGGHGVSAFGMELFAESEEIALAAAIGNLHSPLAWILTVLIIGHIGMALIHHFIRKDDTLKRML
ncbi:MULTISPECIES: cytochrome b [unclassified Halomonas]|uniref:cytochrome b n=1 Tax=unclassified Halomonas TaxID=2609666 RepID=UPI002885C3DA|nr:MULTISPECIES: cytochrome b [unclassified Halomonas]MDT0500776.1 cytochrome b [Halomonas sp. PAR7]MDT0513034.1 cytochrome b [Halomonas sp. LES1]MDT0591555.1 cytochrome b [Halomonas sp. PAR8]